MKLYADSISTTSRPVLMFVAEHRLPVEHVQVSLMERAHQKPDYAAINPNKCVPALVDGDFVLTESSAILKYLADKAGRAYPRGAKERARVNQAMDWLNTGFYRDWGYGYVYPQTFPHHTYPNPVTQADVLRRALERSTEWFAVLNDHWLADRPYLCGRDVTIADYLGAAYVSLADWVSFDLSRYPNVARWMNSMRARPSWEKVNGPWSALTEHMRATLKQSA